MTKKADLLKEAQARNLDVTDKNTVAEIKDALNKHSEEVVVNENENGEATQNTTKEGDESPVTNTESIPQNGVTEIETTPAPNPIAEEADARRTEGEIKFADESNPNLKGRAGNSDDVDQDGNVRTGGKSYGVAANDPESEKNDGSDTDK